MKNVVTLFVVALLTSCDGGAKQDAAIEMVLADGGMGGGGAGGHPSAAGGSAVDAGPDAFLDGVVSGERVDGGGVDDLPDLGAEMPVSEQPDAAAGAPDASPDDVTPDADPPEVGMSTQIFPGLCCGAPGSPCQSFVTVGACCPSSMTATECQVMWGAEAWCYCPTDIGLDCYRWRTGVNMPLDLQWTCAHGPQGTP